MQEYKKCRDIRITAKRLNLARGDSVSRENAVGINSAAYEEASRFVV